MKRILYIENLDLEGRLLSPYVNLRGGSFVTPALMKSLGQMCLTRGKLYHVQMHMADTIQETKEMRKLHSDFRRFIMDRFFEGAFGLIVIL